MPIPIPKKDEKDKDFIGRCVSVLTKNKEFESNKQRVAVCYAQLKKKKEDLLKEDYNFFSFSNVTITNVLNELGIKIEEQPFSLLQFKVAMEVELEHGTRDPETNITNDDPLMTAKIAYAHLKENPNYYDLLSSVMEEEFEREDDDDNDDEVEVIVDDNEALPVNDDLSGITDIMDSDKKSEPVVSEPVVMNAEDQVIADLDNMKDEDDDIDEIEVMEDIRIGKVILEKGEKIRIIKRKEK